MSMPEYWSSWSLMWHEVQSFSHDGKLVGTMLICPECQPKHQLFEVVDEIMPGASIRLSHVPRQHQGECYWCTVEEKAGDV